ncbi:ribonuclease T2 family protein [Lutibaculum baratangense]|nr:hypothetical protein [Lutibaculum baratangense]
MRPIALLAAAIGLLLAASPGHAQGRVINRAGDFDFYVLSLSWSPTYCETASPADNLQCGVGRRRGFIVHGLWPQYERGYPEYCQARPERVPAQVVRDSLDLTPSERLIRHEWEKHGSCSGLTPEGYFRLARLAWNRIAIPPSLTDAMQRSAGSPQAIEEAFIRANPGLRPDGIAVTCERQRLDEVRICLTKQLAFRPCPEVDRRSCRVGSIAVPGIPAR